MKIVNSIKQSALLLAMAAVFFTACNKLELDPTPVEPPVQGTTPTLATLLDGPNYTILKAAVEKAANAAGPNFTPSVKDLLSSPAARHTLFAPDDAAFAGSGIPSVAALAFFSAETLDTVLRCHIIPQEVAASSIFKGFPNFQYPTLFNPAPEVSALARLTIFPSVRPGLGAWVNNVPIIGTDAKAVNGTLHTVFRIVMPEGNDLWDTIAGSPDLTFLEAAINRADSGAAKADSLRYALSIATNKLSFASNLTIFAPTDAAMKTFLIGSITKALMAQGIDAVTAQGTATFAVNTFGLAIITDPYNLLPPPYNAQLAATLTPTVVKGLLVYHILSAQTAPYKPAGIRVFSVNLPTTATTVKTLLNSAVSVHPGVTIQASFVSPVPGISVVSTATVKGAANTTASNLVAKDINCVNGVIHKIDQVLLPQ